ncbi:lactadherin-like [Amphiura filiformis]|uniref:lactadherin-like n=1 Tax=Amphiura filiformis TaxID=82378 RepID=UPI003B2210F2
MAPILHLLVCCHHGHLLYQIMLTVNVILLYTEYLAAIPWSGTVNHGTYRPRIFRRRERRSALFPNSFTPAPIPSRKTCPCSSSPCQNFGECSNTREVSGGSFELVFQCTCAEDWSGEVCNVCDIDDTLLCDQCVAASALGMEDESISDSQITASDYLQFNPNWAPRFGRLNNPNGYLWLTNVDDPNPWIQVDFLSSVNVTGIITQGGCVLDPCLFGGWVYYVHIQTGDSVIGLTYILENESPKTFLANIDADDPNDQAVVLFPETIETRYLRIFPLYPYFAAGGMQSPGMRFEVLGCKM